MVTTRLSSGVGSANSDETVAVFVISGAFAAEVWITIVKVANALAASVPRVART